MSNLVGRSAPQFRLSGADGKSYQMDDFLGNWLLLVFHRHLG